MRLDHWLREQTTRLSGGARPPSPRLSETRLIVLDVDVTGIDLRKDVATGMAILPVEAGELRLDDLAYCPIAPHADDPAHGDWRARYRAMIDEIADAPVLTYNARFVKHMIKHAAKRHGLPLPYSQWIDIASALYGTVGRDSSEIGSMRHWQERMKIRVVQEHAATADVFALAQMLQTLLAYCSDVGITTLDDLHRAQNARVWLRG